MMLKKKPISSILQRFKNVVLLLCCICVLFSYGVSFASSNKEYQLKAAYINNSIKFASWPNEPMQEINLCIIGKNSFGSILNKIDGKKMPKGTLRVYYFKHLKEPVNCQIVYIDESEKLRFYEIIDLFKDRPTLFFSDIEDFANKGGDIEFTRIDDKLKIIINARNISRKNMQLDPLFYQIAAEVIR